MGLGTGIAIGAGLLAGGSVLSSKKAADAASKKPPKRDIYDETRQTLEAQLDLAPDVFDARASREFGDPAYAGLQMDILREHAPELRELAREDRTSTRAGDVADLRRLGPQVSAAWRRANPEAAAAIERQAALLGRVEEEALMDLARGGRLSPDEARLADQDARAAFTARGRGRSSAAALAEVLNRHMMRRQRRGEAMDRLTGLAGMQGNAARTSAVVDPSLTVLGRPSAVNTGQQQFQQGPAFDPFSGYAADLYNTNYNAQAAANINKANLYGNLAGGLMSMGGRIVGGGLAGGYF